MRRVSVTQARNTLSGLIREVEAGEAVHITRRGRAVAVLVSMDDYDRLESGEPRRDFWQGTKEWRAEAGVDWPELTPDEVDGWRDRRPPREPEWPD